MQITYEDFDRLQEQLEAIPNQVPGWLPSENDLNIYAGKEPNRYMEFLLWITFTAVPKTEDDENRLRMINRFLYEKIVFLD